MAKKKPVTGGNKPKPPRAVRMFLYDSEVYLRAKSVQALFNNLNKEPEAAVRRQLMKEFMTRAKEEAGQ